MLFGPQRGVIIMVQPLSIHGTPMVDLIYQLDGETGQRSARLGPEALSGTPQPGMAATFHFLMNVVTRVEPAF